MKKKVTRVIMGVIVVAIWANFIRGLLKGMDDGGSEIVPKRSAGKKALFNDYEQRKDTVKLLLNYRDPFRSGPAIPVKDTTTRPSRHREIVAAVAKPVEDLSFIKYSGFIYNPSAKTTISIISINGKNAMVADGEVAEGVKLIKNMKDSIKISYRNKIRFISRS